MKRLLLSSLLLTAFACATSSRNRLAHTVEVLPPLGSKSSPPAPALAAVVFGNSNYAVRYRGFHFTIEVAGSTERVIAIYSNDKRFRTPEGVRVGQPASSLHNLAGRWSFLGSYGCAFHMHSGWAAQVSLPLTLGTPPASHSSPPPAGDSYLAPGVSKSEPVCPPSTGKVGQLALTLEDS